MEAGFSSRSASCSTGWLVRRRCSWWQRAVADLFGVTRIVNFAHGSFYMLGPVRGLHAGGAAVGQHRLLARAAAGALATGVLGCGGGDGAAAAHLPRPELLQLLATFALVLVVKDAVLWAWGPEELFGPARRGWRAPSASSGGRSPRTTCC